MKPTSLKKYLLVLAIFSFALVLTPSIGRAQKIPPPEERVSRFDALKMYTINAAYAAFEEDIKGSLTQGKLADITVLSKDILSIPVPDILLPEVLMTIVGGKIVYQK